MSETDAWQEVEAETRLSGIGRSEPAFVDSAEPDAAASRARDIVRAAHRAHPDGLAAAWKAKPEAVLRILSALCGAAPFFAPLLERHGDWLVRLAVDDLKRPRLREEIEAALDHALAGASHDEVPRVLRLVKYYELARITVRELCPELVAEALEPVVLAELSALADALLARATELALARTGDGRWTGPGGELVRPGFCVLALGKLGGEELNYSSDVDLIYVYQAVPDGLEGGPRGESPDEFMSRVATELGRIVTPSTADGFLYRIDLDLRPEGRQGALVLSNEALAEYYDTRAATWERAAFMKARPVAGDLELGWRVLRSIAPMIFRTTMDFASVTAIRDLKEGVEREAGRDEGAFSVKIGAGGIRDVECVAQAMQLLHGGEVPQIRRRSTVGTLEALRDAGVLPRRTAQDLLDAYLFLRRVENRLQMAGERQIYTLPTDAPSQSRLARSMGFLGPDPFATFTGVLEERCAAVRAAFHDVLPDAPGARILDLFARASRGRKRSLHTARLLEELADRFGRVIETGPDPERAMNNLARFVEGLGGRSFYYELLLDREELVGRLASLFAASEYLSGILAVHPRLIEPIFEDPETLLVDRPGLQASFHAIHAELATEGRTEPELNLDALRLFEQREILNVGLLDLDERVSSAEVSNSLTDIAEITLEHALELAADEMARRSPPVAGDFLVVGMGKLGTRELTYGSDLDVIFLYSSDQTDPLEAQEYYVRLTQKLIWALQTRTREGVCYEIDTRLRPSGNQGLLVTSFDGYESYHAKQAELWERQAMLRARPTTGSSRLAERFERLRLAVLNRPLPDDAAREIHHIRQRMETELARESAQRRDFKTGRGGLTDIETAVQLLQLRHGGAHPELLRPDRTGVQLERLAGLGALHERDASALARGWSFLTRLASRLRIVENRSISDLDAERGDLEGLARRLGYEPGAREGVARRRLLADYEEVTGEVRAAYRRILGLA